MGKSEIQTDLRVTVFRFGVCALFRAENKRYELYAVPVPFTPEDEWSTLPSGIQRNTNRYLEFESALDKSTLCLP